MASGIRFTAPERARLKELLEDTQRGATKLPTPKKAKLDQAILDKLEKSELLGGKKAGGGIPVAAALQAFRGVLGDRLAAPPNPSAGWYAMTGKRLAALGLTVGDCTTIAKVAGEKWRGFIKVDSLIRQAEVLLQEAQLPLPYEGPVNARRVGSTMEDL